MYHAKKKYYSRLQVALGMLPLILVSKSVESYFKGYLSSHCYQLCQKMIDWDCCLHIFKTRCIYVTNLIVKLHVLYTFHLRMFMMFYLTSYRSVQ
uniref:Uncharacterized protein n=1 Tax=Arundo donax TaxID=35708 RepID=A0A0A8ZF07_ARUDO